MAVISIMCDASHHTKLKLGGYAGVIHIKDGLDEWSEDYSGVAADSLDSNEAEMIAISAGFDKARRIIKKEDLSVDGLFAYTDSKFCVDQYDLALSKKKTSKRHQSAIRKMMQSIPKVDGSGKLIINHVKGHVKKEFASPLEKIHNIIDKRAVYARKKAQHHIFKPNLSGSKHYGVSLPANPRAWQREEFKQLGYAYAKDGLLARVAMSGNVKEGDLSHPYLEGIAQAAKELGVDPNSLFELKKYSKSGGLYNGTEGLDRVLTRHHLNESNVDSRGVNFDLIPYQFAGVASRIMFGQQHPKLMNTTSPTGRVEPASKFVLNLFEGNQEKDEPMYTGEWLNAFMKHVDMPYVEGLTLAMNGLELTPNNTLKDPDRELKKMINEVVVDYFDELTPKQIVNEIMDSMSALGYRKLGSHHGYLNKLAKNNFVSPKEMSSEFSKAVVTTICEGRDREQAVAEMSHTPRVNPMLSVDKQEVSSRLKLK